jgi:paraquat-inducible protein B
MAEQANRMLIGGFVILAVAILAVSVVLFGSGSFFKKKNEYVMFFEGSVKGLDVGAPVLFRGVQVGQVKQMVIKANVDDLAIRIPVIIEVDEERWVVEEGQKKRWRSADHKHQMNRLIRKGLRAELAIQSMITGKLVIEVSMKPNTPINLTNMEPGFIEIPTVQSPIARLGKALEKLDFKKIQHSLLSTLSGAEKLINNPDLKASIHILKGTLADARHFVQHVDTKVDPLTDNLNTTLTDTREHIKVLSGNANTTLTAYKTLARNVNKKVPPLADSTGKTLAEAQTTLKQGTRTLAAAEEDLSADSPLMVELANTLKEFSAMARSVRLLADFLKRHPESLLQGKGQGHSSGGK